MAEEDKKVTLDETPQEKQPVKKNVVVDQEWQGIVEGKYKTPSDVAKAYKDLEKKYGEQSQEVQQAREFMQVVYPLLEEIKNDPELFKQLEKKLAKKEEPDSPSKDDKKPEKEQSAVRDVASELLLAKFEEQHGIDSMTSEEKRSLRKNIGDAIYELTGQSLKDVDLRRLSKTLENAYILVKHKSKSDGSEDSFEDRASFSSVPSKGGKSETVLTNEEADVAKKLGLTREQYLESKKGLAKNKS